MYLLNALPECPSNWKMFTSLILLMLFALEGFQKSIRKLKEIWNMRNVIFFLRFLVKLLILILHYKNETYSICTLKYSCNKFNRISKKLLSLRKQVVHFSSDILNIFAYKLYHLQYWGHLSKCIIFFLPCFYLDCNGTKGKPLWF